MTTTSAAAAALAASRTSVPVAPARTTALIHAARLLLPAPVMLSDDGNPQCLRRLVR